MRLHMWKRYQNRMLCIHWPRAGMEGLMVHLALARAFSCREA